ncbi:MAG: hypothetical protein ABJ215_00615 [Alphaproteobacteria bacterium]
MTRIEVEPYPHAVVNDAINNHTRFSILDNWPARDAFSPEIEGNNACWFNDTPPPKPVHDLLRTEIGRLAQSVMTAFAPWAHCLDRYGVSEVEYCELHPIGTLATDPRAREWAEMDLQALRAPVQRDWTGSVNIMLAEEDKLVGDDRPIESTNPSLSVS